jgi:hypothetical protein
VPLTILAVGLVATTTAAAAATPASAASMKFKRSCYIFGEEMGGLATGFLPNSDLQIESKGWIDKHAMSSDAKGRVGLQFLTPPSSPKLSKTAVIRRTVTLSDPRHRARRARTTVHFSQVVADSGTQPDPRVRRTWQFVGFRGSGPLYGHFIFNDKVVRSYSFGVPKGPCGRLTAKAPGLPVARSKLKAGTWSVQYDRHRKYDPSSPDSMAMEMDVPKRYSTGR